MNRAQMYHDMTTPELRVKFADLKNELFNLRFQHSTGQLQNPLSLNTVKKDIARVLSILRERELDLPKNSGKSKTKTVEKKAVKEVKEEKKAAKPAKKGEGAK